MFYTKIAKIIAALVFFLGIYDVVMGILIVSGAFSPSDFFCKRYLASVSCGKAIDRGFILIFSAVILGVISEISMHFNKINTEKTDKE